VRIDLWQGAQRVAGFPVELDVPFPAGQRHGVFQASFFLKEGR
jgi:hypothetical protein